jgi:hypothetical protein
MHVKETAKVGRSSALAWSRKMGLLIVCNQNALPLKRLPTEQGRRAEHEIGNPLDQWQPERTS